MGLTARLLEECWGSRHGWVFTPAKADGRWLERGAYVWPRDGAVSMTVSSAQDVYFSPLVYSEPHRRSEYALPTHVLWSDLDSADPAQCALRPSAAWKTTQGGFSEEWEYYDARNGDLVGRATRKGVEPHWQALWFLGENLSRGNLPIHVPDVWQRQEVQAQEAAALSKRIAYGEASRGADKSGWDVTQVLRLPGTYNHKHTPPQRIELLWAEKRYYSIKEVEAAYPPVPMPEYPVTHPSVQTNEVAVEAAFRKLPMGLRMSMERNTGGADRSLELLKLATQILQFGCPPELAPAVLAKSAMAQSKYAGRRDMEQRLTTTVADALLSLQ